MKELEEKKRYLEVLTRALCEEGGLRLDFTEEGDWSINHTDRIIICPLRELASHGEQWCAAAIAHEVGHDYLSRQFAFTSDGLSRVYLSRFLNALEDPRVESWMVMKYPGVGRWLSYVERGLDPIPAWRSFPLLKRFFGCCCALQATGDSALLGDVVVKALEATWPARQRYHALVPKLDFYRTPISAEQEQRYQDLVLPRLHDDVAPAASDGEKKAFLYSLAGFELVEQEMSSWIQPLIDQDIERLTQGLVQENLVETVEGMFRTGNLNSIKPLVHQIFARTEGQKRTTLTQGPFKLGEELYRAYWGQLKRKAKRPVSRTSQESWKHYLPYSEYRQKVSPQVEGLKRRFQEALQQKRRMAEQQGHPWGHRPNLNRIMAFDADPRNYRKLWQRRRIPERPNVAVLLLVDLSGSMCGEKIIAAQEGTVLLVETLAELAIPMAVFGFQNVIIPFVSFEDGLDNETCERIATMSLEVSGDRPGGNNNYRVNDDGPCLKQATAHLLKRPERDKVMIVISDGAPSGGGATEADLHAAIKKVTAQGIFLYGLGLGPGTKHVEEFYPNAIASIPVPRLAEELGRLMQKTLV